MLIIKQKFSRPGSPGSVNSLKDNLLFGLEEKTNKFFEHMKKLFNEPLSSGVLEEGHAIQNQVWQDSRVQVLYILSNVSFDKKYDSQLIDFCEQSDLDKLLVDNPTEKKGQSNEMKLALLHTFTSMAEALKANKAK